jgi:hypothetical protein
MVDLHDAAAAAQILMQRRQDDPLFRWQPFPKQEPFLNCLESEAWYIGANRCGKSDALAALTASAARFGCFEPRGAYSSGGRIAIYDRAISIWCVSVTAGLGQESFWPKLFPCKYLPPGQHPPFIPQWEIRDWNQTAQILRLKEMNGSTGSLISLKSGDQHRDVFSAAERDLLVFDEVPPYPIYDEATMRSPAHGRLWIRGAATLLPPPGMVGGVSWMYGKKIEPWLQKRTQGLGLFGASIYDNPHLLPEEIARLEAKYPPGSDDFRIRLLGEWLPGIAGALAYCPPFDRRIHLDPTCTPEHRIWTAPLIWSLDWNVEPMGMVVGQYLNNDFRWFDEITLERASAVEAAREFKRRYSQHGSELWIHGDATSKHREAGTGKDHYTLLCAALDLPYPYQVLVPESNPSIPDRIDAMRVAFVGVDGYARQHIGPHMEETIADCEGVLMKADGTIKKTSNRADPYCRRTSWTDAMGYAVTWHCPVSQPLPRNRPHRLRRPKYWH